MNELFSAAAIERVLESQRLVNRFSFTPALARRTMFAAAEAAAGAGEGLLVVADEQTKGRGREGRTWWAPAGTSLLMSLLLRPSLPAAEAGQLTMCLGLGACEGIEEVTGLRPASLSGRMIYCWTGESWVGCWPKYARPPIGWIMPCSAWV